MTESEWKSGANPGDLLRHIVSGASDRKLRYYAIACCRRIKSLLPNPSSLAAVTVFESFIEGQTTLEEHYHAEKLAELAWSVFHLPSEIDHPDAAKWIEEATKISHSTRSSLRNCSQELQVEDTTALLADAANFADCCCATVNPFDDGRDYFWNWSEYPRYQSKELLRDIFGNPFRPVAFDANWRTSTAVALAQQMYDSRDFSAMPILADALQDAGCENDDVLTHCRDAAGAHVRGCWVVDLVLGKV